MTTFTRFVHVVRVTATNDDGSPNPDIFVDVMVTDKFSIMGTNGQGFKMDVTAANCVPTINDETGDGNSVNNGASATRQTHIIRVTSPTDATQCLDVEVLDKFAATGVNGQQWKGDFSSVSATVYFTAINGPDLSGDFTSSEETVTTNQASASRLAELNEIITFAISSITYPLPAQPPPTTNAANEANPTTQYITVEKLQKINFTGINGQQWKYDLSDVDQIINDTTNYVTDPNTGNLIPPPNTDPDPYVIFPNAALGASTTSSGPFTGNAIVSQGPLWQIINAQGGFPVLLVIAVTRQEPFPPWDTTGIVDGGFGATPLPSEMPGVTLAPGSKLVATIGARGTPFIPPFSPPTVIPSDAFVGYQRVWQIYGNGSPPGPIGSPYATTIQDIVGTDIFDEMLAQWAFYGLPTAPFYKTFVYPRGWTEWLIVRAISITPPPSYSGPPNPPFNGNFLYTTPSNPPDTTVVNGTQTYLATDYPSRISSMIAYITDYSSFPPGP